MDNKTPHIDPDDVSKSPELLDTNSQFEFLPDGINWDDVIIDNNWNDLIDFDVLCTDQVKSEKKIPYNWLFDFIISELYKSKLKKLDLLLATPVISIKRLKHSLTAALTLLFGMCSCSVSYIYSAIFGNSSNRILSV
ncbi:MAG TPA: hypothetical protein PKN48_16435 [Bacteroidales bacterium]|mgnify:CR=1 FL=1|nr:hypothetical protein [Bacteroidales bacterium]